jgi:hypothetical protein
MIDQHEAMYDALREIKQWTDAYDHKVFKPMSSDELLIADKVLQAAGISMSALHASWARHLLKGIGEIASKALRNDDVEP